MKSSRLLAGVVPMAAAAGGVSTFLLLGGPTNRSVTAQSTVALTEEQRSVATSLEGAFMRIADTVGPATVSIEAQIDTPASTRRRTSTAIPLPSPRGRKDDSDNSEFPFEDLFGPQGPGRGGAPFQFEMPGPGDRGGGIARGSGIIVRSDGYILTNDHVVENARDGKVKVTLSDNMVYTGTVLRDKRSDLALIKINTEKPLPFVQIADSDRLRVGQWAVAIGSPFGQQNTVTSGIVSALHRKRQINDEGVPRPYPDLIQTDASINPGNSGGPLLNIKGELIGVNVAIYSPTGTSLGIGYAIPANTARYVMDQLISRGKVTRGSLGVVPADVPSNKRRKLGTDKGAYIAEVFPFTAAEKAGIEPDDVVTNFGTREVVDEISLRDAASMTPPGTTVPITLLRDGKQIKVSATLTDADAPGKAEKETPTPPVAPRPRRPTSSIPSLQLGFFVAPLSTEIMDRMNLEKGAKGLLVKGVQPNSPADNGDLEPNDVITAVDGKPVTTPEELNQIMKNAQPGDIVTLRLLRFVDLERPSKAVVNITVP